VESEANATEFADAPAASAEAADASDADTTDKDDADACIADMDDWSGPDITMTTRLSRETQRSINNFVACRGRNSAARWKLVGGSGVGGDD
jgi:hypothetical protein